MPLYNHETFDQSVLPNGLKADVIKLIGAGVALGWKLHVTSRSSCTLISHDERKKYHFTPRRSSTPLNRVKRDLTKYADPTYLALATVGTSDPEEGVPEDVALTAWSMVPKVGDEGTVTLERPEDEEQFTSEPPHIVSEKPMLAASGPGRGYESKTTIERRWSDGSKDYACTVCDYTSPHRHSVPRHFTKHSEGTQPLNPKFKAQVPDKAIYRPNKHRVAALAAWLAENLGGGADPDPQAIALAALTWVHEQSVHSTEHAAEREELDDSDILNRIRTLLDRGEEHRLQARLREQEAEIEALRANAAVAEKRALEADARATQARENLRAFVALAEELENEGSEAS